MAKLLTQSREFNSNYHNMSFKNMLPAGLATENTTNTEASNLSLQWPLFNGARFWAWAG